MGLSACNSDGTIKPSVIAAINNVVTVTCQVDQAVPGLVAAGGAIYATVDPSAANDVATATKVEQLAHPAVVAACNAAVPASKPIAVVVTASTQ